MSDKKESVEWIDGMIVFIMMLDHALRCDDDTSHLFAMSGEFWCSKALVFVQNADETQAIHIAYLFSNSFFTFFISAFITVFHCSIASMGIGSLTLSPD